MSFVWTVQNDLIIISIFGQAEIDLKYNIAIKEFSNSV